MKNKQREHSKLSNGISCNNKLLIDDILEKHKDLDLTYNDGTFFKASVEDGSVDIVSALLKYFADNQLGNYKEGSVEYLMCKNKLRDILEIAAEDVELSQEMKEILSSYIDFEGSENNDSFLEDEDVDNNFTLKDQTKFSTLKKSHSANDLHNSTFDNSKGNLLTEDNLKKLSNNSSDEKFKFIEEFLEHHDTHDIKNDDLLQKEYHSDLAGNLHNTDEF